MAAGNRPSPINEEIDERTLEGRDRRRGIWRTFRGPAFELKPGGRDAYRSAKLSPFPAVALSGRDWFAFAAAVADVFGAHLPGFIARVVWVFVHLMYLVTFQSRVLVFIQWAIQNLTFSRGAD